MAEMNTGVSAAKVVATIDVPAMYQGSDLPATKNSATPWPAFFAESEAHQECGDDVGGNDGPINEGHA